MICSHSWPCAEMARSRRSGLAAEPEFADTCCALVDWPRRSIGRGTSRAPNSHRVNHPYQGIRERRATGNREENVSVDRR